VVGCLLDKGHYSILELEALLSSFPPPLICSQRRKRRKRLKKQKLK